ncbi:MAG: BamA/TamA family outer membrane protein [Breznakibacter sp.]
MTIEKLISLLCLFLFGNGLFVLKGQSIVLAPDSSGVFGKMVAWGETVLDAFSVEKGRHSLAVYPAAGYTPRTGIEFGVMPIWRIDPMQREGSVYYRPTTLTSNLLVSTTGMYEADFEIDAFTASGFRFSSKLQWLFLPDKFYGVGNHHASTLPFEFDATRIQFSGMVAKALVDEWFVGLSYDFGKYSHRPRIPNSQRAEIEGSAGGWANQVGPLWVYDTRNNATYPQKGWLVQASGVFSRGWMGSGFNYGQTMADARVYQQLGRMVLASQFQVTVSDGQIPFFKMPALGGKRALRGIPHPNKYIGRHMWLVQGELRRDVWWRFGAVVFAGAGESFGNSGEMFSYIKYTAGAGIRFKALPAENLNFRIDYGIASGGDHAVYFTLREAF